MFGSSCGALTPCAEGVVVWGGSLTGLEGSEETHSADSMNKRVQFTAISSISEWFSK
jgi:hypothetical protein